MTQKKDYSLLRPFVLEAAKRGDMLLFTGYGTVAEFIAGPDKDGEICVRKVDDDTLLVRSTNIFSMRPICWVEGRPVYVGDVLYDRNIGRRIAVGFDGEHLRLVTKDGDPWGLFRADQLTWTPPMVKREGWINIYPPSQSDQVACTSNAWKSESAANKIGQEGRVACVRIEWEEPAGGAQC